MFDFSQLGKPQREETPVNGYYSTAKGQTVYLPTSSPITHHGLFLGTIEDVNNGTIKEGTRCDCPAAHGRHSDGKGEDYAHVVRLKGGDNGISCSGSECSGLLYVMDKPMEKKIAPTTDNEGINKSNKGDDIIAQNSTNRLIKASSLTGDITPPRWTIKGVLPEDGLVEFFGASGSYKSFIVLDMCYSIALNREWQGCEVNGGTVVYVAGEGKSGLGRRLKGLELHYQETIDNFYVLPMPTNITDAKEMKLLAEEIAEIGKAKMIIFDTLHRCSAGTDENSASDFAVILKNIDTHIKPLCDVVSWVHHTGLDKSRGRGTSARYASLDAQVMIEKIDNLRCVLTCEKQKEAEPFEPMGFEMNSVDIGLMDEELNPIATLVPHLSDAVSADKKEKPLTKLHHEMIAALRLAIQASGESISEELKHRENIRSGMMVDVSLWRAEAMKILPSNGDTDAKKVHNAKRMRFQRLKDDLVRAKCAIEFNDKALILGDCELRNV